MIVKEPRGRAVWAAEVAAWRKSGTNATEFCRRRGLSRKTFSWWRWKLGASPSSAVATAFVAITPKEPESAMSVVEFEIVVRDVVVRVPEGFDGEALGRLVDLLAARR